MDNIVFSGGAPNETAAPKTFLSHVFSTTEEGKAELLNVIQYAVLAIVPVVALNKTIQRIIPDVDPDKSSLEITIEILLQLVLLFVGIVLIHRIVSYVPTYSGFKYDPFVLTNVIIAFLVIVVSIQTKIGIKTNILVERLGELWNGPSPPIKEKYTKREQATIPNTELFPQPPAASKRVEIYDPPPQNHNMDDHNSSPLPANGVIGGSFGANF